MDFHGFIAILLVLSSTVTAKWPRRYRESETHRRGRPFHRPHVTFHESLYHELPPGTTLYRSQPESPHLESLESHHDEPHHGFPHFRSHEPHHFEHRRGPPHFGYHHEPYHFEQRHKSPYEHNHEMPFPFGPPPTQLSNSFGLPSWLHHFWDSDSDSSSSSSSSSDEDSSTEEDDSSFQPYRTQFRFTKYPCSTESILDANTNIKTTQPTTVTTETTLTNPISPYTLVAPTNSDPPMELSTAVHTVTKSTPVALNTQNSNTNIYDYATTTTRGSSSSIESPSVPQCLKSCNKMMTSEYNPVCGTNNVTYQNSRLLSCAKDCGVDVEIKHTSTCSDVITSNDRFRKIEPLDMGQDSLTSQKLLYCMQSCSFSGDYSPVCGTNEVTYINLDRLLCAKQCGVDVELRCSYPCATSNCHKLEAITVLTTPTAPVLTLEKTTPQPPNFLQCLKSCPVTAEYNPVCGTDNSTYGNPGKLLCAQLCGRDVKLNHFLPCSNGNTASVPTTAASPVTTTVSSLTICMRGCPLTAEYNPVCGTNNVTYTNLGKLECAKTCGVDVKLKHFLPCSNGNAVSVPTTPASPVTTVSSLTICMRGCPLTAEYNPVCGTNNVTYTNLGKLECAKTCGVDVELYTKSACTVTNQNETDTTTPNKPVNENREVTASDVEITTTPFKIDKDLLVAIFGTSTPSTSTTELEDYSLDPRFNNI